MALKLKTTLVLGAMAGLQAVRVDDEPEEAFAHMAQVKVHGMDTQEEQADGGCSGWSPSHGPSMGKGSSCATWGQEFAWCFVSKGYPGDKVESKVYKGKFFAACKEDTTPQETADKATVEAEAAAAKVRAQEAKVDHDTATATLKHAKKVKKTHDKHVKEATQKKTVKDEKDAAAATEAQAEHEETNAKLTAEAAQAKKDRIQADRLAAEDAVLAKAAKLKAQKGIKAAKVAAKIKTTAEDEEIADAKLAEAAKQKADALAGPAQLAAAADAEAREMFKKANSDSDAAIANHAVAEQNAFKKGQEAAFAKETADTAAAQAAEAKAANEKVVELAMEKDVIAKKAAKHAETVNSRLLKVAARKTEADHEAKLTQEAKEKASETAKTKHAHKKKAAKDSKRANDLAVAEVTIAEAAKEESHRATSKAFKALYAKVSAEEEVAKHTQDEKVAKKVSEAAADEEAAAAQEADADETEAAEPSSAADP